MKNKLTVCLNKNFYSRLDKAIFESLPENIKLSRSRLQALIKQGRVLNHSDLLPVNLKTKVVEVNKVVVLLDTFDRKVLSPQDLNLDVIYEDDFLAVINKPANMPVHPVNFGQKDTLVNGLIYLYGNNLAKTDDQLRPGIVHRLDKDTTGLIVIAKTDKAAVELISQFKAREVKKVYFAFCYGSPFSLLEKLIKKQGVSVSETGEIEVITNLGRDKKNKELMAVKIEQGKRAVSYFKVVNVFEIENNKKISLIQCEIKTGRTHQIRVHLSHIGHPILGDRLYAKNFYNHNYNHKNGEKLSDESVLYLANNFSRQALHAAELSFLHPITFERKTFYQPYPADLINLKNRLAYN